MTSHTGFICIPRVSSLTDGLADRVGIVGDLQVREVLADFLGHLLWGEAHGSDVVGTQGQLALWGLHELYRGTMAVGDMHHGKASVGTQVALVVTCAERVVEDLNGVVCEHRGHMSLVRNVDLIIVNLCGASRRPVVEYLLFLLQESC